MSVSAVKSWIRTIVATGATAGLAACGSGAAPLTETVPAQAFDAFVTSPVPDNSSGADTTRIAISVYVPEHRAGETYPLILHSHGWGGDRVTEEDAQGEFDAYTFYSVALDEQVSAFWVRGYAVISMDQRGFQDSGGASRVMDPEYETRDAMAVLDWAEANLDLAYGPDGLPRVGTLGGSYGGGFQLLLAALDPRVTAIAPAVTWHHLPDALAPGGVLKKMYAFGLCFSARLAGRRFSDELNDVCLQAGELPVTRFEEQVDEALIRFLGDHGMRAMQQRHEDPDDAFRMRRVDALLVQGMRDILFPLNEALHNFDFLAAQGGDVRLITHQHGHIIGPPLTQQPPLGSMNCGELDSIAAIHAWYDEKLRGIAGAAAHIPRVCLSLDDERAVHLDQVPFGGAHVVVVPDGTVVHPLQNNFGGDAPTFVPLAEPIDREGLSLAGVPLADLAVSTLVPLDALAPAEAVALVGIGVQSAGGALRLLDDQVTPLRASRPHQDRPLAGVGARLQPGDVVGVLFYGVHDEFDNAGKTNYLANAYTVGGSVRLPIVEAP